MLRRRRRYVAENRARLDRGEIRGLEALRDLNFAKGAVGRGDEVAGRRCCVAQLMDPRAVPGSNKNMKRMLKLVLRVGLMLQWRGRDIRVDHMLPGGCRGDSSD